MGENQVTKLMRQGREGKLGMIKPTLENPDVIIEDVSEAKDGETTERKSSYVFVKAFKKADGSRYYYFTSVTVGKDGKEVVISNQEKRKNAIANLLTKGKLVWKHADDVSAASDVEQGLYSSQGNMSDPTTEGTDAPQTNDVSEVFTRPALEPDTNTDTSGVDSGRSEGVTTPAGNSPRTSEGKGSESAAPVQEWVDNKGRKIVVTPQIHEKDDVIYTDFVVTRDGKEISAPTIGMPFDADIYTTPDIPEGFSIVGIKQLRQAGNKIAATVIVRGEDGGLEAACRAEELLREMSKRKSAPEIASVPNEEHHHAVISVAEDGAKVVKNLETLAKTYENLSGQRKNVVS